MFTEFLSIYSILDACLEFRSILPTKFFFHGHFFTRKLSKNFIPKGLPSIFNNLMNHEGFFFNGFTGSPIQYIEI